MEPSACGRDYIFGAKRSTSHRVVDDGHLRPPMYNNTPMPNQDELNKILESRFVSIILSIHLNIHLYNNIYIGKEQKEKWRRQDTKPGRESERSRELLPEHLTPNTSSPKAPFVEERSADLDQQDIQRLTPHTDMQTYVHTYRHSYVVYNCEIQIIESRPVWGAVSDVAHLHTCSLHCHLTRFTHLTHLLAKVVTGAKESSGSSGSRGSSALDTPDPLAPVTTLASK